MLALNDPKHVLVVRVISATEARGIASAKHERARAIKRNLSELLKLNRACIHQNNAFLERIIKSFYECVPKLNLKSFSWLNKLYGKMIYKVQWVFKTFW